MVGVRKPMPRVSGDEYCSALLKRVLCVVQCENSAAFQNVERFVHVQMSMDRNARTECHLLGPQAKIVGPVDGANLDKDVAMVAEMNEMFAFSRAQHISLWRRGLGRALGQYLADGDGPQVE